MDHVNNFIALVTGRSGSLNKTKLIRELAAIINVDEITSEEMLKNNDWNVQKASNKYLDFSIEVDKVDDDDVEVVNKKKAKFDENIEEVDQVKIKKLTNADSSSSPSFSRVGPERFSIMTWNLDGLDQSNLKARTEAVIKLVKEQKHDVIFFQELIKKTFEALVSSLEEYIPIPGTEDESHRDGYFTATFVRFGRVNFESHEIFPFPNSEMGRTLLTVKASIGSAKFYLLNTHSESTAVPKYAQERVNQMRICFEKISNFPNDHNVIFGGDLNARDQELNGLVPPNLVDLWIASGSNERARFTWDLTINTNKQLNGKPRCRFDRLFFRGSEPATMTLESFEFTGTDKVPDTEVWPSDHFAIVSFFNLMN